MLPYLPREVWDIITEYTWLYRRAAFLPRIQRFKWHPPVISESTFQDFRSIRMHSHDNKIFFATDWRPLKSGRWYLTTEVYGHHTLSSYHTYVSFGNYKDEDVRVYSEYVHGLYSELVPVERRLG